MAIDYIAKAGSDLACFDMGAEWNAVEKGFSLNDDDMFSLYKKRFLDELIADGKPFHFSHDPNAYKGSALWDELNYLRKNGYVFDPATMTAEKI